MQPSMPDPNQGGGNPYAPQNPGPAQPGFGQQSQNPYAPPTHDPWGDTSINFDEVPQGTYWGGFAAGFVFALLGLIIVYVAGKDETKRGALHGFGIRFGLGILVFLFALAAG